MIAHRPREDQRLRLVKHGSCFCQQGTDSLVAFLRLHVSSFIQDARQRPNEREVVNTCNSDSNEDPFHSCQSSYANSCQVTVDVQCGQIQSKSLECQGANLHQSAALPTYSLTKYPKSSLYPLFWVLWRSRYQQSHLFGPGPRQRRAH